MNANATIPVPLDPAEKIKRAKKLIHHAGMPDDEVRQRHTIASHTAIFGCEAEDVYEVETDAGRTIYGVVTSQGEFAVLADRQTAVAEACRP